MLFIRELSWIAERKKRWRQEVEALIPYVKGFMDRVRDGGDEEIRKIVREIDRVELDELIYKGSGSVDVDDDFVEAVNCAKDNIEKFCRAQLSDGFMLESGGKFMGQRIIPVRRVGIYVPGGRAAYPSTVLMAAVPAIVAGVSEIALATPVGPDGTISPYVLYVAGFLGIDEIYMVGGVPAIAAFAYGTESIRPVDIIAGPGNIYVTVAKKLVMGDVGVDIVAGPSEIVIVADRYADPRMVAVDMLAQAEHDEKASAILITDSEELIDDTGRCIDKYLSQAGSDTAYRSIAEEGGAILVDDILDAVELANEIAPEHLELMVQNPIAMLNRVRNAGTVFLGENTPEAMGDYVAGPDHILPTMGSVLFSSGVSVRTFLKEVNYLYYSAEALKKEGKYAIRFAEAEGLYFHGLSVRERLK